MRNRIAGGGAVVIGIAFLAMLLLGQGPIPIKPLLGALAFIGVGAYYFFADKRGASLKEFVVDGKVLNDKRDADKK